MKTIHLLYCPFSGLGNFGGFRGNRWLKNRIQIFKQFVVPSLQNQTSKNFILWVSWRSEEKNNLHVKEFVKFLDAIKEIKTIHTFHGICFWDDKYSDVEARDRLLASLHDSLGELVNTIGECEYVLMTIQPSDDLYHSETVERLQTMFQDMPVQALGFERGYIINYRTGEVAEWNPDTNPPFYTIKFPRDIFVDPLKHAEYTSIKKDVGKYKAGTPCPSHEYIGSALQYGTIEKRGFIVGVHGENISTVWNHPFKGQAVSREVLKDFGIYAVPPIKIKYSLRKRILRILPHRWQRKIRYWFEEKIYEFFRS